MSWDYKNTVLIYTSNGFEYSPNVACCGLLHTLIKVTESERWEMWSPKVLEKLSLINEKGASLVIFSNQTGQNISSVKCKFTKFIETLTYNNPIIGDKPPIKIPVIALFSMKKNCFKKPFTNIWKVLGFIYRIKNKESVDISRSIFIGGCDGGIYLRNWKEVIKNRSLEKRYAFRSDADRAFAKNIGISFISNKTFFLDKPESKWQWNAYVMPVESRITIIKKTKDDKEPDIVNELYSDSIIKKHLILIMGLPSSGKKTLSKILVDKLDGLCPINTISDGDLTRKKFHKTLSDSIFEKTTIVITKHSDYKTRNEYISIARKYEAQSLIIYLKTEKKICNLLNYIKVQISRDFDLELYNASDYIAWQKKYESPDYVESDIKVVEYPMILRFRNEMKLHYS